MSTASKTLAPSLVSSFSSEYSNPDLNDTIDELENAIYDTNILTADAIKRILSQQREAIFARTICWCSALAFHLLMSKEKGLTIKASKDSAEESFEVWVEKEGVSCSVKSCINNAMLSLVRELFSSELLKKSKHLQEDKKSSNSEAGERCATLTDEEKLTIDLKLMMGANFKETFINLYSSTCWMILVAYIWGTSFPKLTEEDRRILDKAWSSPQVTAECRQQFTNFGIEAIIALLTEKSESSQQLTEISLVNLEVSLLDEHQSLIFPDCFSVEYTPSRSRLSESGQEWEVEEILARRFTGTDRRKDDNYEYWIKWKGYGHEHNTWEKFEHLHCRELIVQLKRKERWLRQRNMQVLSEESILQFEQFQRSDRRPLGTLLEESYGDTIPLRLEYSSTEDPQISRSTY